MLRRSGYNHIIITNRYFHSNIICQGGRYPPVITAKHISDSPRLTVKPLNSRKTLLMDQYKSIWEDNKMILFVHYNNLLKQEDHQLRLQLNQLNINFTHLRNNLFKVYLKNMNRIDPVAPYDNSQYSNQLLLNHPINKLIKGPTALISYSTVDSSIMNQIFNIIKQSKGKLIPLGAVIDGQILNLDWINKFNEINGNHEQIYQMLIANLQSNAGGSLINNLQLLSNKLVNSLSQHKEILSKEN